MLAVLADHDRHLLGMFIPGTAALLHRGPELGGDGVGGRNELLGEWRELKRHGPADTNWLYHQISSIRL